MAKQTISSLFFEDLNPGDEWESPSRTVTESDVVAFAGISGDFNPIHVDHHAAKDGAFGRPMAHGLLGLSIASGLSSHAPRVETIAFLAIEDWKFLQPIFFGDTIRVISRVEAVESRARGRRALITWKKTLVNQDGATVQEGTTQTLVKGRAFSGNSEKNSGEANQS
jgi:3-hydroxybutyryl-CoA dehydratase